MEELSNSFSAPGNQSYRNQVKESKSLPKIYKKAAFNSNLDRFGNSLVRRRKED